MPLATLSDLCAHKLCHSAANVLPKCCSHFVIRSPAGSTLTPPPARPALSPTGRAGQLMNEHWPNSFTTRRSLSPSLNPNPNSNALFQFLPNACACGRPQIAAGRQGKGAGDTGGYHMMPQLSGLHWNFNLVAFNAASCCAAGTQLTAHDPQVDQDLIAF